MAIFYTDTGSISILEVSSSLLVSRSLVVSGSTVSTGGFTGSLFGTASYVSGNIFTSANPILSASYSLSSSYALSSSFASTASFITLAQTASYVLNAQTASFITLAQTASLALRASGSLTGSLLGTASWSQNSLTASSADNFTVRQDITASNGLFTGTITAQTLNVQFITASTEFITGSSKFGTLSTNTHQFTGSVTISGSLAVVGAATITNLTASVFGTSSWSQNAVTASFITLAQTASFVTTAQTASYVLNAQTASFVTTAQTASSVANLTQNVTITGSLFVSNSIVLTPSGSISVVSGSITALRFSGSLFGTASWSQNSVTASFITLAQTASFVTLAQTASYVLNAQTASFITLAQTASLALRASGSLTGSLLGTASYVTGSTFTSANPALSASYAITASYALNGGGTSPSSTTIYLHSQSIANTVWNITHNLNSQYPVITVYGEDNNVIIPQEIDVVNVNSLDIYFPISTSGAASIIGNILFISSSFPVSSSYSISSSFAQTASFALNGGGGAAFPFTGSARITGSLIVTGSISATQGFTGSLFGTASYAPVFGKQDVWIPASAMSPTITSGSSAIQRVETTTNRVNYWAVDFDQSISENAYFQIAFPRNWNLGTITAFFYWTPLAVATGNVLWAIKGLALSDSDIIDSAWGTEVTVTDAYDAATDLSISVESGAITIGGTPTSNDLILFNIRRDAANVADTLTTDARLVGVKLVITTNANTSA
jgi:hypothetical protein